MTREILCYHGTSLEYAESINFTKTYQFGSRRDDHWLGFGVYFFEEDLEQAKMWAKSRYKYETTATLETIIRSKRNLILNLNSRIGIQKLETYLTTLEREHKIEIEVDDGLPTKPRLANLVFSSLSIDEVWVITKGFSIPSQFDRSKSVSSLSFNHKGKIVEYTLISPQVCVRNLKAIKQDSIKIFHKAHPYKRIKVEEGGFSYDLFSK